MNHSEIQTRLELIDKQLALAGWNVKDSMQVVEEFYILTDAQGGTIGPRGSDEGRQFSDYILLGKDGKPLAVIEAKNPLGMPRWAVNRPSSIATNQKRSA